MCLPHKQQWARHVMGAQQSFYGEEYEGMDEGLASPPEDQALLSPYEISLFIDEVEDLICSGITLPFTSKAVIDKEECLETLGVLRANWPWEMLEARRIVHEEGEVLERAETEAEKIRQQAERQAEFILDQSQLVKVAEVRAQEIIDSAHQEVAQMLERAEQDVRDVYQGLERELDLLLRDLKQLVAARLGKLRR